MEIVVNGKPELFGEGCSVAELLARYELAAGRVAVEVNEHLVPRSGFDSTALRGGDRVEIVTFVGGG